MTDAEQTLRQLAAKYGMNYAEFRTEPDYINGPMVGRTTISVSTTIDAKAYEMCFVHEDSRVDSLDTFRAMLGSHVEHSIRSFRDKLSQPGDAVEGTHEV